jgi:glycosyltransferase involved in cell wall biosynthesis
MNILEVNTTDFRGGAAQVAFNLMGEMNRKGHHVKMLVSRKTTEEAGIIPINSSYQPGTFSEISKRIIGKDIPSFVRFRSLDFFRAMIANDYKFFRCSQILRLSEFKNADILHFHNLHGNYFNLELLCTISKLKPVIWTLHDMWGITGHCAYSYGCERWREGCGKCPNLKSYPPVAWDNTRSILAEKNKIYDRSDFTVVVPSVWLEKKAQSGALKNKKIALIHNGIDISDMHPIEKHIARKKLNIPEKDKVVLFLASGGSSDPRKGWGIVEKIIFELSKNKNICFLSVGNKKKPEINKNGKIRHIKYIDNRNELAQYYSAADVFLFTSLAENFPLVILEAMACGVPIVSFDVGGVGEAMEHKKNGYLAKYGDSEDLIRGIEYIFNLSENKRKTMSENSVRKARERYTIGKMSDEYMKAYIEAINDFKKHGI